MGEQSVKALTAQLEEAAREKHSLRQKIFRLEKQYYAGEEAKKRVDEELDEAKREVKANSMPVSQTPNPALYTLSPTHLNRW